MKKLITRKEDVIIVLCDCGCSNHLLQISKWKESKAVEYFFSIAPSTRGFFNRLKYCWHILRKGNHTDEIILNPVEVKQLVKTLETSLKTAFKRRKNET